MIALLGGLAVGYLAGRLLWLGARDVFGAPGLLRANYRGAQVPTAVGALIVLAVLLVEAGRALAGSVGFGVPATAGGARPMVLGAVVGFGLLGVLDDILGDGADRGFRGHLGALARGRVTTGLLKLVGGGAVALVAVAPPAGRTPGRLLADAALVALAANLGNLFDRAPGRVLKAGSAAFLVVAVGALVAGTAASLVAAAVVMGAALSLLGGDLAERLMLGDAGSNVVGAVIGLASVLAFSTGVRSGVLVAVLALNLAGEIISFSRIIEGVPVLRRMDAAGRIRF